MDFAFWLLSYVVPFLAVLTIIVFVHEMGHYLVARWNGIAIQAFSIGFGPELIGFNDKRGTRWKLSAIPLGGYVRFVGDMNAASMPDEAFIERVGPELSRQLFVNKNVWQRISVVIAGPVANIIFTLLVLYALLLGYGRYTIPPVLDAVPVESVAGQAGKSAASRISSALSPPLRSGRFRSPSSVPDRPRPLRRCRRLSQRPIGSATRIGSGGSASPRTSTSRTSCFTGRVRLRRSA